MVQQAESSRQATILGMNQSVMAGVNANYQQQLLNQQKANAYANQTMINSLSSLATLDLENIGGNNYQSVSPSSPNDVKPELRGANYYTSDEYLNSLTAIDVTG